MGHSWVSSVTDLETSLEGVFRDYGNAQLALGRSWVGETAAVVEFTFTGNRGGHRMGLVAAAVLAFDPTGRATSARVYLDVPTLIGQGDPLRLPDGLLIRSPVSGPPAGREVAVFGHSQREASNLEITRRIWARLDAHDAAGVLADSSEDYLYEDFSGPATLGKKATEQLVSNFLGFVADFTIAEKPTWFAAGDDVITESVEHMALDGRPVVLHSLDVKHFDHGQVTREWQYANGAEALAALTGVAIDTR